MLECMKTLKFSLTLLLIFVVSAFLDWQIQRVLEGNFLEILCLETLILFAGLFGCIFVMLMWLNELGCPRWIVSVSVLFAILLGCYIFI